MKKVTENRTDSDKMDADTAEERADDTSAARDVTSDSADKVRTDIVEGEQDETDIEVLHANHWAGRRSGL